ncbi:MAG TPA: hypothetical protein ENK57_07165 [Polyangiaceae bacterium]|nr:hypothetical protein [Polyangiaceae bacterium]
MIAACGTLPADEIGDSYPAGDAVDAPSDDASPTFETGWPSEAQGRVAPEICEQLACGSQSCTDGICNALAWRTQLSGAYEGELGGVAMTPEGDVVIAGSFAGVIKGHQGPVESAGAWDVFVAKLAWTGELMWLERFGGEGSQRASSLSIGDDGQIVIGGELEGSMTAGDVALKSAAHEDGFVLVLDEAGLPRWGQTFGDTVAESGDLASGEHQTVSDVLVLPNGYIGVAGTFYGSMRMGEDSYVAEDRDGFVAFMKPDGTFRWSRALTGPGDARVTALAADADSRLIAAGAYTGELTVEETHAADGGEDAFVVAYDTSGTEAWLESFGGPGHDRAASVAVESDGSIVVAGTFADSLSFGGASGAVVPGEGGGDGFLARLRGDDGSYVSARAFGDGMHQSPAAVSVSLEGRVAVVGWFSGTIDFGMGAMTADEDDAFVAVFGEGGFDTGWSHRYGPGADQHARAATHRSDGALVVAGEYVRAIDLGWGPLGSDDLKRKIFVAALTP